MASKYLDALLKETGWKTRPSEKTKDHIFELLDPIVAGARVPIMRNLLVDLLDTALGEKEVPEEMPEDFSVEDLVSLVCCVAANAFSKKTLFAELEAAFALAKQKIDRRERISNQRSSPDPTAPEEKRTQQQGEEKAREQEAIDRAVRASLARLGLETAVPVKKLRRCEGCGETKARCICHAPLPNVKRQPPPPPPTPPKTTKAPKPTTNEADDDSADDDEDEDDDEDTTTEDEDETEDNEEDAGATNDKDTKDSKTKLSLDKAGVLLEPKKWKEAAATHGVLELVRAVRFFYRAVAATKPFDEGFLGDILAHVVRAMVAAPAGPTLEHLCAAGARIIARYEFFQDEKAHGATAAGAAEAELCNRTLPKAIAKARRLAEKRAAQQKQNHPQNQQPRSARSGGHRGGRGGHRGGRGGDRGGGRATGSAAPTAG